MKNKSSKLRHLESKRYSILTNDLEHCYICGLKEVDIHEIYGGCNRKVSMSNGLCIPVCRMHHKMITLNASASFELKKLCQQKYEETHTRQEWFRLIGKNYLE